MEVLHSTPVACFIGASNVEEKLGDFTDEIELTETDNVKEQCALLAQAKAYKLFALGMDQVGVYLQLTWKTNTMSGELMEQIAKKALAKKIACLFIP